MPGLEGSSLGAETRHTHVRLREKGRRLNSFSIVDKVCGGRKSHLVTHTHIEKPTSQNRISCTSKCAKRHPRCVEVSRQRLCESVCVRARISQSATATVPSRWPTVIRRSDFMGPSVVSVTKCAFRTPPLDQDHIAASLGALGGRHRS